MTKILTVVKTRTEEINKCWECDNHLYQGFTCLCSLTGENIPDCESGLIPSWCPLPEKTKVAHCCDSCRNNNCGMVGQEMTTLCSDFLDIYYLG
jgi:hypothetical protein